MSNKSEKNTHKTLLDTDILGIQHRLYATTGGDWFSIIEGRDMMGGSSFIMTNVENADDTRNPQRGEDIYLIGASDADMDFIAHARQDIPRLLAEIERLNAIINTKNL
jgi:hypothetical protein